MHLQSTLTCGKWLGGVNHLAVFLDEAADMGIWQDVEHCFRGPAEFDAFRRDDDGPVDQDRMRPALGGVTAPEVALKIMRHGNVAAVFFW